MGVLVRVKDHMSLRKGMWDELWNDIIMRNVIYFRDVFIFFGAAMQPD